MAAKLEQLAQLVTILKEFDPKNDVEYEFIIDQETQVIVTATKKRRQQGDSGDTQRVLNYCITIVETRNTTGILGTSSRPTD